MNKLKHSYLYSLFKSWDEMTFQGHAQASTSFQLSFLAVAFVAFLLSHWLNKFSLCLWCCLLATLISLGVFAPAWKRWKVSPLEFARDQEGGELGRISDSEDVDKLLKKMSESIEATPS